MTIVVIFKSTKYHQESRTGACFDNVHPFRTILPSFVIQMKNVYRNQSQETKYIYKSSILKFESTKRENLSVEILFLLSESHRLLLPF